MPGLEIHWGKGLEFTVSSTPPSQQQGNMNGTTVDQGQGGAGLGARIQQDAPKGADISRPTPPAALTNYAAKQDAFGRALNTVVDNIKNRQVGTDEMKTLIAAAKDLGGTYWAADLGAQLKEKLNESAFETIQTVQIKPGLLTVQLDRKRVRALCGSDSIPDKKDLHLALPFSERRRGVELKLVVEGATAIDETLMRNLANANHWYKRIKEGATFDQVAAEIGTSKRRIQQMVHLAFLAPDIVRQITKGKQPLGLTSDWLLRHNLPADWNAQCKRIANL